MADEEVIKRIEKSKSFDDLAKLLWQLLASNISVWKNDDGTECFYEIRVLVDKIKGLKIEIRPRDHAPPHFHVSSGNKNAAFLLETGELIQGNFNNRETSIIRLYFKYAKSTLINIWNETRSSDSVVGEYKGN